MIHPYTSILSYEGDNFPGFIEEIELLDVFIPVIKSYSDPLVVKCVVHYILLAYSQQSDKIILGLDWQKNKQQIFEFVLAKPEKSIYEDLVHLKNQAVLETVSKWLDFQDMDSFKQLQVLKDLRVEMQLSSLTQIRKASGEVDYDQKFKNAEYSNKLKQMIKDLESELVQNDSLLKEAVKEIKQSRKAKDSRNVGTYAIR